MDLEDKLAAETPQPSNDTSSWAELIPISSESGKYHGDIVQAAQTASARLKNHVTQRAEEGVRIWKGPSADQPQHEFLPPITENQDDTGLAMERDFTTPGTPSRLGCPFASMAGKQLSSHAASVISRYRSSAASKSSVSRFTPQLHRSRRPSIEDPIRADTCGMENVPESSSPTAAAGICPIRFLDQHKPEEIAQYFEKHKHELPRSHENCVRRYQSNSESIRQLDAKYGNLVSMIQGLGAKHQPMLPETPPQDEEGASDKASAAKIQEWARTVSADLENTAGKGITEGDEEDRQPHFDRPLKEIRVGESPSRPWGITVPPQFDQSATISSTKPAEISDSEANRKDQNADMHKAAAPKCPFKGAASASSKVAHHGLSLPKAADEDRDGPHNAAPQYFPLDTNGSSRSPPQMLFTGPVFIGYPMDQALSLIQQSQPKTQ